MAGLSLDEKRVARVFSRLFKEQRQAIIDLVKATGTLGVDEVFWQNQISHMAQEIRPVFERIFISHGNELLQNPTKALWSDFINLEALDWARNYSFNLVKNLVESTRKMISRALSNFISTEGYDIRDFIEEIDDIAFDYKRCQLVAITEVTRAYSESQQTAAQWYRDNGVRFEEVWDSSNDNLVCELCGERHGKVRGVDWTDYPPLHPGCRCGVSMRVPRG